MANYLGALIPFIIMIGMFYLLIFLPENKRKKKYNEMLNSLKLNDEVITKGGIIGKLVNVQDKFVIIETGPDRMRIKFDKNGISHVLNSANEEVKENKGK